MGYHYVPRKYLQGFCEPGSGRMLWQYDKVSDRFARVSVGTAANERGFYSDDVEAKLAAIVEAPADRVLSKLRSNQPISSEERAEFAFYMATMLKRVPASRKKADALLPSVLEKTLAAMREAIAKASELGIITRELEAKRLAETEVAGEKFRNQTPPEVIERAYAPWPSDEMAAAIYFMQWRFVTVAKGPSFFITTDNPVFFFECYGLGQEEAELFFPISTDLALHGCWQPLGYNDKQVLAGAQWHVREFNRRIASAATRFVYYHQKAAWIREIALKTDPYLSRIIW